MSTETFDFGTPAVTDQVDGATLYVLGIRWTASEDSSWTGNSWLRVPDSVDPAVNHYMLAYDSVTHVHLATAAFTAAVGTRQDVSWSSPIAVTAGTEYIACVLTHHYVYRAAYTFPETDGRLTATGSRLILGAADTERYPTDDTVLNFYVSPIVAFAADPVDGVLAAVLPALTAALTGDALADGQLAGILPALTAALVGDGLADAVLTGQLPTLTAAFAGDAIADGTLAAILPALTAAFTDAVDIEPGTHTAGGTSTTHTAAGTSSTLTAAGTAGTLTASGRP